MRVEEMGPILGRFWAGCQQQRLFALFAGFGGKDVAADGRVWRGFCRFWLLVSSNVFWCFFADFGAKKRCCKSEGRFWGSKWQQQRFFDRSAATISGAAGLAPGGARPAGGVYGGQIENLVPY